MCQCDKIIERSHMSNLTYLSKSPPHVSVRIAVRGQNDSMVNSVLPFAASASSLWFETSNLYVSMLVRVRRKEQHGQHIPTRTTWFQTRENLHEQSNAIELCLNMFQIDVNSVEFADRACRSPNCRVWVNKTCRVGFD